MKLFNWLRGLLRREAVHVLWKPAEEYDGIIGALEWSHVQRREFELRAEIARLRRNKKKYSHLQKELDALIDKGADTQTNNGDDQ